MRLGDVPEVVRLCNQAFLESARRPAAGARLVRSLQEHPRYQLVATAQGKIVGVLQGRVDEKKRTAGVRLLGVHPRLQRQGIGSKLLRAIERRAKKDGLKKIELGTPFALPFYEKCGYKCVRTRHRFIRDITCSEIQRPKGVQIRRADMEDLAKVIKSLPKKVAEQFLIAFYENYVADDRFQILGFSNKRAVGAAAGKANQMCRELLELRLLYGRTREIESAMVRAFEYEASKRGRRYVGVTVNRPGMIKRLNHLGYEEAHEAFWWTAYHLEKALK
jgi:N-acetylglutamate synthase-like GNAT family acetyltransferase